MKKEDYCEYCKREMDDSIKTDIKESFKENQLMKKIIGKFFDENSSEFTEIINSYVEEKVNEIN